MTKNNALLTCLSIPLLAISLWLGLKPYHLSYVVFPLLVGALVFCFGKRVFNAKRRVVLLPLSVLAAHGIWALSGAGAILMRGHLSPEQYRVLAEILCYAAAILWLGIKPGRWPLICLLVYSTAMLVLNLIEMASFMDEISINNALIVHIIMRAAAIRLMIGSLYVFMKKAKQLKD